MFQLLSPHSPPRTHTSTGSVAKVRWSQRRRGRRGRCLLAIRRGFSLLLRGFYYYTEEGGKEEIGVQLEFARCANVGEATTIYFGKKAVVNAGACKSFFEQVSFPSSPALHNLFSPRLLPAAEAAV